MEFIRIVNPETNRKARLDTRLGKRILKQYIRRFQQYGGTDAMGKKLNEGDEVHLYKHGELDDNQHNLHKIVDIDGDNDCDFKNHEGDVAPCTWMTISKKDDLERDGDEAEEYETYYANLDPGDVKNMKKKHLDATVSKGVVVHPDNNQDFQDHLRDNSSSDIVSRAEANRAGELLDE